MKSKDNSKKSQKSQIQIRAEIVSVENSRRKPIEDKSTKKKEKKQLKDLFKHKTDDEVQRKVNSQTLEFKNSNKKDENHEPLWKESTLKRNRLFMDSQNSISSINDSGLTNNLINLSSMMGLNFERSEKGS